MKDPMEMALATERGVKIILVTDYNEIKETKE